MKLINSLILFSFYCIYLVKCQYQCHKPLEECHISFENRCEKGYTCQSNPDNKVGIDDPNYKPLICLPELKFGDKCNQELSCPRDLYCISPTGYTDPNNSQEYCLDYNFAETGEKCEFDAQCKNGPCENSTCIEYIGRNKEESKHGEIGQFCEYDSQCRSGLKCLYAENKCIEKYSLDIGHVCDNLSPGQCDISKKLTCQDISGNGTHTCQIFKPDTKNCSERHYCENGSIEFCNLKTEKCEERIAINGKCKQSELARDQCYLINNCNGDLNLNKRSCQMKHCQLETNNYLKDCDNIFNLCL